jgi:hypothetical protein
MTPYRNRAQAPIKKPPLCGVVAMAVVLFILAAWISYAIFRGVA